MKNPSEHLRRIARVLRRQCAHEDRYLIRDKDGVVVLDRCEDCGAILCDRRRGRDS